MDAEQLKQSNRQRVAQISKKTETVLQLADKLERLADQLEGSGLSAIAEKLETFNEKLSGMPEQIASMQSVSDKKLNAWISQVNQALSSIELSPQFQVEAPNVEVKAPGVDLSPITSLVSGIEKSINSAVGSIKMPETEDRTDELKEAMEEVRDAINGLVFPVAEHPLPFKDSNGKPTQVQLDGSGNLPISASISGADGAITDGVSSSVKATVIESTSTPGTFGLVTLSPDGTDIAGGSGGDATAANQTTIIGHVDGIEGLLTTIDADTGNLPTIETNTDFGTVTGGGTETGALRVTVANNSTGVLSVDDNGSTLSVDDGGGSLTVDGTVAVSGTVTVGSHAVTNAGTFAVQVSSALPAGTNAIGKLSANSGVDIGDVDVTSIAAGANTIGGVAIRPETSNGLTIFRSIDLDETEEEAKGTAGQVYGWYIYNTASSVRFVKLYNATAASVSVGTTTPVMTIPIPPTSGANVEFTNGIAFSTAITAAATTGVADSDTGAPGANEVIINLLYK